MDFTRLKALLEAQETFPFEFTVKFIGVNSAVFLDGVRDLEGEYPALRKQSERKTPNDANLALTYLFPAVSADVIIALLERVSRITDLKIIL